MGNTGRRAASALAALTLVCAAAGAASGEARPSVAARASNHATPSARVGAFFFDGWSGNLGNFHWGGLLGTPYSGRRPLSGWTDDRAAAIEAQLAWAHAAGIGFFVFDWYFEPHPGNGPINMAHDTYVKLRDHRGVGYALNYVNQSGFVIPPDAWAKQAEKWVTGDFVRREYARIAGKPLLVILDEHGFNVQMGGARGVNAAIETLQESARRHGLPGVFVVGGRYLNHLSESCFPQCLDTDAELASTRYDALTEFSYPGIVQPRDGARPYGDAASAIKRMWAVYAQRSPFRHIPSVMAGFDARPMIVAGQIQTAEQGGWPLLDGRQTWFERSAADVGALVRDGIAWVGAHPSMRVEPSPAPPVVLIQSWNELQEGAFLVPTDQDGYAYVRAVAEAVGIGWTPPPKRELRVRPAPGSTIRSVPPGIACPPTCGSSFDEGVEVVLTATARPGFVLEGWAGCRLELDGCSIVVVRESTAQAAVTPVRQRRSLSIGRTTQSSLRGRLAVRDGYRDCANQQPVRLQRRRTSGWTSVATRLTGQTGSYSFTVRESGTYRAYAPAIQYGGHRCIAVASRPATVAR